MTTTDPAAVAAALRAQADACQATDPARAQMLRDKADLHARAAR